MAALTRDRSVVGDETSEIQRLVVDVQLLHAADELPGAEGEVVRHVGNSAQEQRTRQVQGPKTREDKEGEERRLGLSL